MYLYIISTSCFDGRSLYGEFNRNTKYNEFMCRYVFVPTVISETLYRMHQCENIRKIIRYVSIFKHWINF